MWNGIGGKLEPGEDPFAACVREVREETGLAVAAPALRALLVITVRSTGALWIIYVFSAWAPEGALAASDEGDLRWVDPDELSGLPAPADLAVILPRVLEAEEESESVSVVRLEYATEEAATPLSVEVLGA